MKNIQQHLLVAAMLLGFAVAGIKEDIENAKNEYNDMIYKGYKAVLAYSHPPPAGHTEGFVQPRTQRNALQFHQFQRPAASAARPPAAFHHTIYPPNAAKSL